jgi:hypothetical protein
MPLLRGKYGTAKFVVVMSEEYPCALEMGVRIRHLKAGLASQWLRPHSLIHATAKP